MCRFDKTDTAFKVILPSDLTADKPTQLCGVNSEGECVLPFWVNAPDTFWARGDCNLTHATSNGWLRVFGRGLSGAVAVLSPKSNNNNKRHSVGSGTAVVGVGAGASTVLHSVRSSSDVVVQPLANSTANAATYLFDSAVPPGVYTVTLQVDGQIFDSGVEITVVTPQSIQWPSDVYHVNATAWAAGLAIALNATRANGGGIILLSRGVYDMTGSIDLPPFTTLRGDSAAHVSLRWDTEGNPNPPQYLVGGNASFAVRSPMQCAFPLFKQTET